MVTNEVKAYIRGYYGRPPAPIDPQVRKKVIGEEVPIQERPADLLSHNWRRPDKRSPYMQKEEDVLSYALFRCSRKVPGRKNGGQGWSGLFHCSEGPRAGTLAYHPI